ncbi:hypothetical protein RRG08_050204 [Elysia crispata]|uniref:Uncharacterized protein n=1 Tax=Elysia crispata TaxID=231223 RepID=A0AAE0Z720_9GAST|nr:hypothetical protein RRG08_050204 [Elysia crispata]
MRTKFAVGGEDDCSACAGVCMLQSGQSIFQLSAVPAPRARLASIQIAALISKEHNCLVMYYRRLSSVSSFMDLRGGLQKGRDGFCVREWFRYEVGDIEMKLKQVISRFWCSKQRNTSAYIQPQRNRECEYRCNLYNHMPSDRPRWTHLTAPPDRRTKDSNQ